MIKTAEGGDEPVVAGESGAATDPAVVVDRAAENPATDQTVASEPSAAGEQAPASESGSHERDRYARLYEDEQRKDGRFRWSVGHAGTHCRRCHRTIPSGESFHTVLTTAQEGKGRLPHPDLAKVFERQDICVDCFAAGVGSEGQTFAHWLSVLPAPEEAPKKVVNMASLRAYFDRLDDARVAALGKGDDSAEDAQSTAQDGSLGDPSDFMDDADIAEEDAHPKVDSHWQVDEYGDNEARLQYMLALFLVRKKALRWQSLQHGELSLYCKQTERTFVLPVPRLTEEELAASVQSFEELFQ